MSGIFWNDRLLVGHPRIDETHREFASLLNALFVAADEAVPLALDALVAHLREHFAFEEELMTRHDFPARGCHADEHEQVLISVEEVRAEVAAGDSGSVRALAEALEGWFSGHVDYMDSALAAWVSKRTFDGAPLVFRRDAVSADALNEVTG